MLLLLMFGKSEYRVFLSQQRNTWCTHNQRKEMKGKEKKRKKKTREEKQAVLHVNQSLLKQQAQQTM
jgi:hypothetical protein